MDWKDLGGLIGSAAPVLGGLIGGPAGATIGTIVSSALGVSNTPDAVSIALNTNPDAAVKLKQIEMEQATRLRELAVTAENNRLVAETAAVVSVNQTMQVEAKSDHWATWFWRPFIGLSVGLCVIIESLTICSAYVGVIFFKVNAEVLSYLPAMLGAVAGVIATTMPVLGIASYFRGKMQADPNVPTDNRG